MVKLSDPRLAVDDDLKKMIIGVLESGRYILGNETTHFEREFSRFCHTKHGVAVSSGTAALHLALLAAGIKPGDEVITTTHSFIATANAIVHAGGKPVLVDIERGTHNIDPSLIEEKITDRTKCIVPVHLYGHPVNMDPVMEIAAKHGLLVVEDACQAHGAEYKGKRVGSIGDAAAFSFFPSKVMTVFGDGGMITTRDGEIAGRARMLRNQGRAPGKKYEHDMIGFNCRMPEILAAAGRAELRKLPGCIAARRKIASAYNKSLGGVVTTPVEEEYAKAAYYVYTVTSDKRDALQSYLNSRGIETGVYYPVPIHRQPAYRDFSFQACPVADEIAGMIISLPIHPYLKKKEIEDVIGAVIQFCK